jgi:hypothetical protein
MQNLVRLVEITRGAGFARVAVSARWTGSRCRSAGVFETPGAFDAFAAHRLILGTEC